MEIEKGMERGKSAFDNQTIPKGSRRGKKKEKKIYGGWVIGLYCHPCNLQFNEGRRRA
jgi:hypothetical protein